jgi:polysaccharide export outer membrane protein
MIGSRARALFFTFVLSLSLVGCGSGAGTAPSPLSAGATGAGGVETPEVVASVYKLGPADRIKITVFNHTDLSGEFSLDGAGNFALPLIGEVQGGGLTSRELEQRIQDRLKDGYLIDPQVSIEVMNYRPFYILGEVKTPGSYPYVDNMNILNAVALAGGFTYRAKQNAFMLQRGGSNSQAVTVNGSQSLLPGDIVTVQERFF